MQILAKEEAKYEAIPTGMQQAVGAMVCDIGTHEGEYQGKKTQRHQIVVIWELGEKKTEGQFAGQPFFVSKFYALSLDKKANLRKDLESWRGIKFTDEELKNGFDVTKLVGANCFLNIIEDGDKAKVSAITPLAKGMPKIIPTLKDEPKWIGDFRQRCMEITGGTSKNSPTSGSNPPPPEDDRPF